MPSIPEPAHLNNHHRDTMRAILRHPTSHNVEWKAALSLLEAVGSVERRHDGKYLVTVGGETEVFAPPRHKEVDTEQIVDMRRLLRAAGYDAGADHVDPDAT
jgi:hypothetical protein